jgi:hypothetical protein
VEPRELGIIDLSESRSPSLVKSVTDVLLVLRADRAVGMVLLFDIRHGSTTEERKVEKKRWVLSRRARRLKREGNRGSYYIPGVPDQCAAPGATIRLNCGSQQPLQPVSNQLPPSSARSFAACGNMFGLGRLLPAYILRNPILFSRIRFKTPISPGISR